MRTALVWVCLWLWACGAWGDTVSALQEAQALLTRAYTQQGAAREQTLQRADQILSRLPKEAFQPLREQLRRARETLGNDDLTLAQQAVGVYLKWARAHTAPPSSEAVKQQLERIFAEPDMKVIEKTLWERVVDAIREGFVRLIEALNRLFGRVGGVRGANLGPVFQWLVIALLILALALFASYLMSRFESRRAIPKITLAGSEIPDDARALSADEWHRLAQLKAQSGEYALAVRALYLGVLRLLHENRLLAYDPALTNWEHLERLRKPPTPENLALLTEAYRLMLAPTIAFDRIWYGNIPATEADYHALETVFQTLQQKVRGQANA